MIFHVFRTENFNFFQNLLDRKKRESRAFSIMDNDSPMLPHMLMAANKRESRAFSIMDTDSPLAGGLLGARANMNSPEDPDFDNQRKSMFARRQTMRQSMVSQMDRPFSPGQLQLTFM